MSPEDHAAEARRFRGDPRGDPLEVILYRLGQIERRMDRLVTSELYTARHEALQARVLELEREAEESSRSLRQVAVGLVLAVGTAVVTAGIAVL